MKALALIGALLAATAALVVAQSRQFNIGNNVQPQDLHVMLVLDTTGSMQPVLNSARAGAAHLIGQLQAQAKGGVVRIGLVAYRDQGETYITRQCPSDRPEQLSSCLSGLTTGGGGDVPEAVLEGLQRATEGLNGAAPGSRKAIVLVGDAPGHRASTEAINALVQSNARSGIVTHTLQWGDHGATALQWQNFARLGKGRHAQLSAYLPDFGPKVIELLSAQ
ncbi:MAG: VWA domain-containing protein [Lysobacterales bacterium]